MNINFPKDQARNPLEILRKAGYSYFKDPQSGEESFVARLGPDFYPRFHLYLKEKGDQIEFSLHLDQKKASYDGSSMHNGEYDGPTVEKEAERIKGWVAYFATQSPKMEGAILEFDKPRPDKKHQLIEGAPPETKKAWWKFWE